MGQEFLAYAFHILDQKKDPDTSKLRQAMILGFQTLAENFEL